METLEGYDFFDDEDDESWDVYLVNMEDLTTGKEVGKIWPVYARNFDEAMDIYSLIYKMTGTN